MQILSKCALKKMQTAIASFTNTLSVLGYCWVVLSLFLGSLKPLLGGCEKGLSPLIVR